MTRQEWIDEIGDFGDLRSFCLDNGYQEYETEKIVSDYDLDSWIDDDIRNADYSWRTLRDSLNDIPDGYDYYRCNGSLDYEGLTQSDFEDWKAEVLEELDADGFFDEEEHEDQYPDFELPEPDLFDFDDDEPADPYRSREKPRWMCHATAGDNSIPVFETAETAAMLGLLGGAQALTA